MTQTPRMLISADEVNCLIHAYFQDSGFIHSAFVLRAEGHLDKSAHFGKHIPRGELVELLGKAMLYSEVEAHWRGNAMTNNCKASFSLLEKHACALDPTMSPLRVLQPPPPVNSEIPIPYTNGTGEKRKATPSTSEDGHKEKRARTEEMEVDSVTSSAEPQPTDSITSVREPSVSTHMDETVPTNEGPEVPTREDLVDQSSIGMLKGHQTEVFVCAWNPTRKNILGTGSKDSIVHIWDVHDPSPDGAAPEASSPLTFSYLPKSDSSDLTSLDWSPDGSLLASGSCDCLLRICDSSGKLYFSHEQHKGPVFATRFSRSGQYLLSASLDGTVCIWDISNKSLYAQYTCHREPCLDVEWISDDIFASCGADEAIQIMRIDSETPVKTFVGHSNEVNQIKCNQARTLLASCSDDTTARIWDISDSALSSTSSAVPIAVLAGHNKTVSSIAWCPSSDSTQQLCATSSFDGTSRLWDAMTGECLRAFSDHKDAIYALTFSPDGRYMTTGGADGWMFVYDVKSKERRWSWRTTVGPPGIFEIDWQQTEGIDRMAFGMSSGLVGVIDVSRIPDLQ